jgi:hypothetical protein
MKREEHFNKIDYGPPCAQAGYKMDQMKKIQKFKQTLNERLNDTNFIVENAKSDVFYMDDEDYEDEDLVEKSAIE